MVIQYCSDLHLEFRENRDYIRNKPIAPTGDVLLLAGDVIPFARMDNHKDFFSYLADNFEVTYWLPGNHEYYHSDIGIRSGTLKEQIRDNVLLVNNTTIELGNARLLFSTLWSKVGIANEWQVQNGMSDFKVIQNGKRLLDVEAFNRLHKESLDFLNKALADKGSSDKTVVVTHHVPTFEHYPDKYKGSALNEAFAVEMSALILETTPDYWIYGHSHCNTADFEIGDTKMLTNQLGYVHCGEHLGFRDDRCLII